MSDIIRAIILYGCWRIGGEKGRDGRRVHMWAARDLKAPVAAHTKALRSSIVFVDSGEEGEATGRRLHMWTARDVEGRSRQHPWQHALRASSHYQ